MKKVEVIFDACYLLICLGVGIFLFQTAQFLGLRWAFSMIVFLLLAGDSFHLIPRIFVLLGYNNSKNQRMLGVGKFVASITMSLFYLGLWEIGIRYYSLIPGFGMTFFLYSCIAIRILLCIMPQNEWLNKSPSVTWGIYRNLPFVIAGIQVMLLYLFGAVTKGGNLSYLWIAIGVSFLCYIPVVLFAQKHPKVGMLMLPKSCAYVAIIIMGYAIVP